MKSFAFLGMSVFAATVALGHGVQVQISYNAVSGKIETREIVHTSSRPTELSDLKRVYVMPLMPQVGGAGDGWYTRPDDERNAFGVPLYPTGPGVTYQYESQLAGTGWNFSGGASANLQGTRFSYSLTDSFKAWTGGAFEDPGIEQMQLFRGDGTSVPSITTVTSDAGPFSTIDLSNINTQSSNAHSSMGFRILGNGTSSGLSGGLEGDDGIYLLSMQLTSNAAGVAASEPFFYVMYKNRSVADALNAAASLGFDAGLVQLVPEPSSLALLVIAVGCVVARRR